MKSLQQHKMTVLLGWRLHAIFAITFLIICSANSASDDELPEPATPADDDPPPSTTAAPSTRPPPSSSTNPTLKPPGPAPRPPGPAPRPPARPIPRKVTVKQLQVTRNTYVRRGPPQLPARRPAQRPAQRQVVVINNG